MGRDRLCLQWLRDDLQNDPEWHVHEDGVFPNVLLQATNGNS